MRAVASRTATSRIPPKMPGMRRKTIWDDEAKRLQEIKTLIMATALKDFGLRGLAASVHLSLHLQ